MSKTKELILALQERELEQEKNFEQLDDYLWRLRLKGFNQIFNTKTKNNDTK